jgi:pimeloyl-ACP methyl ester carboxylesterase
MPGYSIHNKTWVDDVAKNLGTEGVVRPIYWRHWTDPNAKFNVKESAALMDDLTKNEQINIIAKSIGVLVASHAILKNPGKIKKVIFCGIPFNDISDEDKEIIKEAIRILPDVRIICFQNEEDPHGDATQLKLFLNSFGSGVQAIVEPGETHDYPYYQEFKRFLLG